MVRRRTSACCNSAFVYFRRYHPIVKSENPCSPWFLLALIKLRISSNSGESEGTRTSTHSVPLTILRPPTSLVVLNRDLRNATSSSCSRVSEALTFTYSVNQSSLSSLSSARHTTLRGHAPCGSDLENSSLITNLQDPSP